MFLTCPSKRTVFSLFSVFVENHELYANSPITRRQLGGPVTNFLWLSGRWSVYRCVGLSRQWNGCFFEKKPCFWVLSRQSNVCSRSFSEKSCLSFFLSFFLSWYDSENPHLTFVIHKKVQLESYFPGFSCGEESFPFILSFFLRFWFFSWNEPTTERLWKNIRLFW